MNDYEFVFISTDNYELRYTNKDNEKKVIPFTRTIEMASKLQGIVASARLKMYQELTKMGMTKEDLVIKTKNSDGTTTYNETNYKEFEKKYIETQSALILNEIIEDCFKMDIVGLFTDMGIDANSTDTDVLQKVTNFSKKFSMIISGKDEETPSVENLQ